METYFNIRFEFDKDHVIKMIDSRLHKEGCDYICVADGNITANVHNSLTYRDIINNGMFSISDSSWTPIFLKLIYGIKRQSYTGSDIFQDLLSQKTYNMAFLGGTKKALIGLNSYLNIISYPQDKLYFLELPFKDVSEFDYERIAEALNETSSDIIWVGLGAPKQEIFMSKLKPHLKRGIMIGIGAVFNFYGNTEVNRAPTFLRKMHLEFLHRIFTEPKKQVPKFINYIRTLPRIVYNEYRVNQQNQQNIEQHL